MTNQELEQKLEKLVRKERRITNELLLLVAEAERRKLHLERGSSSMVRWLIKRFKYSESAAVRRVNAARILIAVPEAEEKLEEGKVNITILSKAQSAMRAQEKKSGGKIDADQKAEVVEKMEGLTEPQAEKTLMKLFPAFASSVKVERRIQVNAEETRLSLNLPEAAMANLEKARDLLSHKMPEANFAQVIIHILEEFLAQSATGPAAHSETKAGARREVKAESPACTYQDPETGQICGSTYQLEIDHIQPRALGGTDEKENLRILCKQHNLFMAEKTLGKERANAWRNN